MITRKQLAAHWRITPQMAGKYFRRGCSRQSLEAADEWRKLHSKIAPRGRKPVSPVPVVMTVDDADNVQAMIAQDGTLHRPSVEANLRTLDEMTAQAKRAVAHALESGENEIARRWTITLTNIIARSAITAAQLQDLLERDNITMRLQDVKETYVENLAEMRRIVEAAVDSLPAMLNPADHGHAHEVFSDWFNNTFLRSMYGAAEKRDIGLDEWAQLGDRHRHHVGNRTT